VQIANRSYRSPPRHLEVQMKYAERTHRIRTRYSAARLLGVLCLSGLLVAGCGIDDVATGPDNIEGVAKTILVNCQAEPVGVYFPECRPSWGGYGTDNTAAIKEAIYLARVHVDATNCDIRTTPNRSPYNSAEPWCGSVVFSSGRLYVLSQIGYANATYVTPLEDSQTPAYTDYSGDGFDPIFGITLEADSANGSRPILSLSDSVIFGIGNYDRVRHLHFRGPMYNTPLPWCTGKVPGTDCAIDRNSAIHGSSGGPAQGLNIGWKVDDCLIEGFWGYAVIGNWSKDATVSRSILRRNGAAGVYLERGRNMNITDNTIYENGANGVDLGLSIGSTLVARNTIYNNGWREWPGENRGILVNETSNNNIRNNTVYNTGTGRQDWGINVYRGALYATTGNLVHNNTVHGHRYNGILVGACTPQEGCGVTDSTTVSNNRLFNNAVTTGYQLDFFGSVSNTVISNNVITPPGPCYPITYPGVTFSDNKCRDAYGWIQAELTDGRSANPCVAGGALGCLYDGDWARYDSIEFGSQGARSVKFRIGIDNCCAGRLIEVRLDGINGPLVASLRPGPTGSWVNFVEMETGTSLITGRHDVYLVFKGGAGVGNIDAFKFSTDLPQPRNPYNGIEGVTFDEASGFTCVDGGGLACLDSGGWVKYANVDFGSGAGPVVLNVGVDACCTGAGRSIEIRLDGPWGPLYASLVPSATGGWTTFSDQGPIWDPGIATGIRDVYVRFQGGPGVANLKRMTFYPY
jgi:parallel beta-helix repeat protein